MKTIKKACLFLTLALVLSLLMSVTALAHGVRYQGLEGNRVQFTFDDDSALSGGFITVYDAYGQVIAEGTTDADGIFDFSAYPDAYRIAVQDLAGHRSVYHTSEGVMPAPAVYRHGHDHHHGHHHGHGHDHDHDCDHDHDHTIVIIAVVAAAVVVVAVLASRFSKKKKS